MAEYRFCTVADEGRVRIVTINRPEVMNALHSEAHWEFDRMWNEFAADPELWVGKGLYTPHAVVRAVILGALYAAERTLGPAPSSSRCA